MLVISKIVARDRAEEVVGVSMVGSNGGEVNS
jgi:pyruvate/2-oxoglutarate dehydrogenase complex dihydrolipoamide dehydrogenase (E3) component